MSRLTVVSVVFLKILVCSTVCCSAFGDDVSPLKHQMASPNYQLSFPRDHGSHNQFETEWWYYTGNLYKKGSEPFRDKPQYGFQLTFFRKSNLVGTLPVQGYLAHGVITDIDSQKVYFASRVGDESLGVASVAKEWLRVQNGTWIAEQVTDQHLLSYSVPTFNAQMRLLFTPQKVPLLQGKNGFSKKGECQTCASHYYSFPGAAVTGEIHRAESVESVYGLGWMDHEFMSNALASNQDGWDWMALVMKDGRRITLFQVRGKNGVQPFLSGKIVKYAKPDGTVFAAEKDLNKDNFSIEPVEYWTSSVTKATYPVTWRVKIPSEEINIEVKARVNESELNTKEVKSDFDLTPVYWEGPVSTRDESVIGYLEMTGYARNESKP